LLVEEYGHDDSKYNIPFGDVEHNPGYGKTLKKKKNN
jgi:hypothetical protein